MRYFLLFFLFISCIFSAKAQKFYDAELLSGNEPIIRYGMDTTQNWWAITASFTGYARLTVNGRATSVFDSIQSPVFSPDGVQWAAFALKSNQWHLLTADTVLPLPFTHVNELQFSPNSEVLAFVGYRAKEASIFSFVLEPSPINLEKFTLVHHKSPLLVIRKKGSFFLSWNGANIAYVGARGSSAALVVNGVEGQLFDDILPFGFWNDGLMLYAGKSGLQWRVYKNDDPLTGSFTGIREPKMNFNGTNAVFIGTYTQGELVTLISEQYSVPIVGKLYDNVNSVVLHPSAGLFAYRATQNGQTFVVMNRTEYLGAENVGLPQFSFDGSELFFLGCNTDCFMSVNGKRNDLETLFDSEFDFAIAPCTGTFAFSSSTSLTVRRVTSKAVYSGFMVDEIGNPRFNWRENRYETLGRISERLYLIWCEM